MNELRNKLKAFMFDRDMKLKEAAVFFGVSIGTISKFINGKQSLNQRNAYRIDKILKEYTEIKLDKSVHAFSRNDKGKP